MREAGGGKLPFDDGHGNLNVARVMKTTKSMLLIATVLTVANGHSPAEPTNATVTGSCRPLHAGRVNPKLCGNFMELREDLPPSMWAEKLNDRSFTGINPRADWTYGDGALNMCGHAGDKKDTWTCETTRPFNGARRSCARCGTPGNRT